MDIEDAPLKESTRPHHLGYGARYPGRRYHERSEDRHCGRNGMRRVNRRNRVKIRKTVKF